MKTIPVVVNLVSSLLLVIGLYCLCIAAGEDASGAGSTESSLFFSEDDGKFDISEFLSQRYGFVPVPLVITEPAVGYGGGVNVMFLHDSFGSSARRKSPPGISGVAGAVTENGTLAGAAYHLGFWRDDSIRTTSAAGATDINIDFYLGNRSVATTLRAWFCYQELMFRLGESSFFLGGNYIYGDIRSTLDSEQTRGIESLFEQRFKMGALGGFMQYDTRDTMFTPSRGIFAKATVRRFDDAFGGRENFWRFGGKLFYYLPFASRFHLGLRLEGEGVAGGSIPFFARPFVMLRGIPSMRYQGQNMLLCEMELRYEVLPRWDLVLFMGAGKVFGDEYVFRRGEGVVKEYEGFSQAEFHPAGGGGFRYELARKYGLWAGLDFATSDAQDFAFYITVGSAWMAF